MDGTRQSHGVARPVAKALPWSAALNSCVSFPLPRAERVGLPVILAAFTLLWTVYSAVTEAPVAIKHDMAEAYTWGIEWQLGYYQHPPFWAWVCGLWFSVFPRTGWAFALLSSLNAAVGLWGAWMALGHFAEGTKRRAACALLLLTPLYTFYAYKYNANTIFLSIWPWTIHFLLQSMERRRIGDALGFGVCLAFALLSKYYALILAATCFVAALQHPARNRYFRSAAPYLSVLTVLVVCAPHLFWLLTHDAPPVEYLGMVSGRTWDYVLGHAAWALIEAVAMNLGVVALAGWAAWRWGGREEDSRTGKFRVLATLVLAPVMLSVIGAVALRTTLMSEMMVGVFPLLPLFVIEVLHVRDANRLWWVAAWCAVVLSIGAAALSPVIALARTYVSPAAMKVTPDQEIAAEATRFWHEQTGRPLVYVAGSPWYDIETAFYSTDHPHVFVLFYYPRNLWVTPERLAQHGLLSICVAGDAFCLDATAKFATREATRMEVTLAHRFWGHVAAPVHFVMTVIPPRE